MKRVYGYARISTDKQNIDRQTRNILASFPDAVISTEVYTGTKFQGRKKLEKILAEVQPGDTIVFDSVSRMSRDAQSGFQLYKELFQKGVDLVFLKESYVNTSVFREELNKQISLQISTGDQAADRLMQTIIDALNVFLMDIAQKQIELAFDQAEKEVDDLHQRTREGIETARRNGKQIGRKAGTKVETKKSIESKQVILKHSQDFGGSLSDPECMKLTGLSRNTFYKYKRELKEAAAA